MGNGSLDQCLHKRRQEAERQYGTLDWKTRLAIAIGAARGLCYMHHDCSPPIVHHDVKSSNILLDSAFGATIADFGLARMLGKAGEADSVSGIAGSFGYIAPECGYQRKVNEKIDVYSFGVVLLELVTGNEANDERDEECLAGWTRQHLPGGGRVTDHPPPPAPPPPPPPSPGAFASPRPGPSVSAASARGASASAAHARGASVLAVPARMHTSKRILVATTMVSLRQREFLVA